MRIVLRPTREGHRAAWRRCLRNVLYMRKEIEEAALLCRECKRWFSVDEGISRLLPDQLRDSEVDLQFLKRHEGSLPTGVLKEGGSFNLGDRAEVD